MTEADGTTYPKTLAALREQEDRSWAVADALVAEVAAYPGGQVRDGEMRRCAEWLGEQGYDVTAEYLARMRMVAIKFPRSTSSPSESREVDLRRWSLPFRLYMAAAQSSSWSPGLMDQAEQGKWTLRQFSEALTGKRWADDDIEAAKRVLRDPGKLAEAAGEMRPEEAASAATELHRRAWQPASNPPVPPQPARNDLDAPADDPIMDEHLKEIGEASPLAQESLGAPIGVALHLMDIRSKLGLIYTSAVNPRIDWSTMREQTADSLHAIATHAEGIADILMGGSSTISDSDIEDLLRGTQ